jgi:hypothetical protein
MTELKLSWPYSETESQEMWIAKKFPCQNFYIISTEEPEFEDDIWIVNVMVEAKEKNER